MLNIKNYADHAELYIYGNIITDTDATWLKMMDDGTLGYQYPTKIKEQLDEMQGKPVDVHIASDGGDVAAGMAIYNMLANHDAPVTVYIDSWAASIASFIAMAGQKIVMPENTFIMIHNPRAEAYGESMYLRTVAEWLDKLQNMLAETYASKSVHTVDEIKEMMNKETWFTATEAWDTFQGIELTEATETDAVAKTEYKTAPEALRNKALKALNEETKTVETVDTEETEENINKEHILEVLREAYTYEEKG